ncbi:MAG: FAD-dependent oxidoreductase [Lentisphaeria bacterium]|nr:FAD-dependent oxidoreductase [Lentisphaeria bacterium]
MTMRDSEPCDVLVAGGGTGGVVAALAAARTGARTTLVESKGYTGGIAVEGGTALHSFYNLWKAFPGIEKRQVVKGIPQEIIDRLAAVGGTCGHAEMDVGYDYDSVATVIDTELYKVVTLQMLDEAGVRLCLNTMLVDAEAEGGLIRSAVCESRSGRERIAATMFVDCTGIGDLAARAGAGYVELNDYPVANSIGVGGVSLEGYRRFLEDSGALRQLSLGRRSGRNGQIVRLDADSAKLPKAYMEQARAIGFAQVITSVHDDYFMFVKLNCKMPVSPTDRDAVAKAEVELRRRQQKAIELIREFIPGCEKAFIARTSPTLCIRRGRTIECDYDITREDVLEGRHADDEIMVYGFHDCAPRLQIRDGGTYGIPYRALRPKGLDNLLVAGMMITTDWEAHMSTRNTVGCMGQGQGAGTAAALCARRGIAIRDLPAADLRQQLVRDNVYLGD